MMDDETGRVLLALTIGLGLIAGITVLLGRIARDHESDLAALRADVSFLRDLARAAERSEPI